MTNPIAQLNIQPQPADIREMVQATRAFTRTWQAGDFKFASLLHENLQRHKALLSNCQDQTIATAQRLIAKVRTSGLDDIIAALNDEQASELFDLVQEGAHTVVSALDEQLALFKRESAALEGLPVVDGTTDRERLVGELASNASRVNESTEDSARVKAELEAVQKAIGVLEDNGLQTRFGGTVPSLEALSALAVPGAEAVVAVEAVSQAIKDLEKLLGDIVVGMRYSELQRQGQMLRNRARAANEAIRNAVQKGEQLTHDIALLDTIPALRQQREHWQTGAMLLIQVLEQHRAAIVSIRYQNAADVSSLDSTLHRLMKLEQSLLAQIQS